MSNAQFTIYQTQSSAVQVSLTTKRGALYMDYNTPDHAYRYIWVPDGGITPVNADIVNTSSLHNVMDIAIYHNDIVDTVDVLSRITVSYSDSADPTELWSVDELSYTKNGPVSIHEIDYNRVTHIYLPDTSTIRGMLPGGCNTGVRGELSIAEYIVPKSDDAISTTPRDTESTLVFSMYDPFNRVIGLSAETDNSHINVGVVVPDWTAFITSFNRGYACYIIRSYTMDGTVDTSKTISGVAERTLVKTEKYLINIDDEVSSGKICKGHQQYTGFNISPRILDPSVAYITVEISAAFWKDDFTSIEDMHTGVCEPNAYYISRDPVSLSDKRPLANGFYDVSWDDCIMIVSTSADAFKEVEQKYSHVPGPSTLKVYNCIKASDPAPTGNNKSGYTLFKIQADKEQVVSTPTSIIVPYYDVICTVGNAALENIENQSDTSRNDLWTSQK